MARDRMAARPLQRRGDIALRRGDRAAAQGFYERAAALDPSDPWVRLSTARLYAGERRFDEALQALDAALAAEPEQPAPFHRVRSEIELQRGDRAAALAAAERAVQTDPADMWSHFHLAGVLQTAGDLDGAAAAAVEAERLAVRPNSQVSRRLAEIEARRGNSAEALQHLESALAADPGDPWSWLAIAGHRLTANDLDAADTAAARAAGLLDGSARAHALRIRAQVATRRKNRAAAVVWLDEAMRVAPEDPWSRLENANHLFDAGDPAAALAMLQEAMALCPAPNVHMLCRAAAFEQARNDTLAARKYLNEAMIADPKDPQPWSQLAHLLTQAGELDAAAKAAERAVDIAAGERRRTPTAA
jgi:tetratricopeptide (TPR) repeat protein